MENKQACCGSEKRTAGSWSGLIYGLFPHSICIAFIIASIVGVTAAITVFRSLLLIPYLFHILVGLSLVFTSASAAICLKREDLLSLSGIKKKWKYLLFLYGTTVGINLALFMIVLPLAANVNLVGAKPSTVFQKTNLSLITLAVAIPCPGHALLIIDELGKVDGVVEAKFKFPNVFVVTYDSDKTSPKDLLSSEVFKTYKAAIL